MNKLTPWLRPLRAFACLIAFGLVLAACASQSTNGEQAPAGTHGTKQALPIAVSPVASGGDDDKDDDGRTASHPHGATGNALASPATGSPPTDRSDEPFDPGSPRLGGIPLGASDRFVADRFGEARDVYRLGVGDSALEMWDYDGLSVGFASDGKAAYVEIAGPHIATGWSAPAVGMNGADAAEALGVRMNTASNVVMVEVDGGLLKLDLDPESQAVVAMKLIAA